MVRELHGAEWRRLQEHEAAERVYLWVSVGAFSWPVCLRDGIVPLNEHWIKWSHWLCWFLLCRALWHNCMIVLAATVVATETNPTCCVSVCVFLLKLWHRGSIVLVWNMSRGRDERPTIILIRDVAQSLRNVAGHMCAKVRWEKKNPMRRLHGLQFSQKQSYTTSSKIRSDQANLIGMFTWGGSNKVGV